MGYRAACKTAKILVMLTLRDIGKNDFEVIDGGNLIGRITLAFERSDQIWIWKITASSSDEGHGSAGDLEQAMWEFRRAWLLVKGTGTEQLTPLSDAQNDPNKKANT